MTEATAVPKFKAKGLKMKAKVLGCCIRFYESGPKFHTNTSHVNLGFDKVFINARGDLEVHHDGASVVSINPSPDETLALRGITVGGSGGAGTTHLVFTVPTSNPLKRRRLDLNDQWDYNLVQGETSNLWLTITQAVSE